MQICAWYQCRRVAASLTAFHHRFRWCDRGLRACLFFRLLSITIDFGAGGFVGWSLTFSFLSPFTLLTGDTAMPCLPISVLFGGCFVDVRLPIGDLVGVLYLSLLRSLSCCCWQARSFWARAWCLFVCVCVWSKTTHYGSCAPSGRARAKR